EAVAADEPIAELETDKVTLEVPAPASGTLSEILAEEGANVPVGAVLGTIADGLAGTLTHPVAGAPGSPLSRNAGEGAERSEAGEGLSATLPLPDKPSVAVLPFANMSSDPEQEFLADGIAEDVITALSRYPSLFVIARN